MKLPRTTMESSFISLISRETNWSCGKLLTSTVPTLESSASSLSLILHPGPYRVQTTLSLDQQAPTPTDKNIFWNERVKNAYQLHQVNEVLTKLIKTMNIIRSQTFSNIVFALTLLVIAIACKEDANQS